MGIQFRADLPLFLQIADWLKRGIVEGTLSPRRTAALYPGACP